jgi:hypothetical protein
MFLSFACFLWPKYSWHAIWSLYGQPRRITEGRTIRQALASPLFGRTLHDLAAAFFLQVVG